MRTTFSATLILLFFISQALFSQSTTIKNVYLIDLQKSDSTYTVESAQFVSSYNSNGQNEHPYFINNQRIYISSSTTKNGFEELDIYELNLQTKKKIRITSTVENEFYPKSTFDSYYFSAIREEADMDKTKRLWKFPVYVKHEEDMGKPLFPYLRGIENYEWINRDYTALVVEAKNSNRLFIGKVSDNSTVFVGSDTGICIHKKKNSNNIFYVDKSYLNKWVIKEAVLDGAQGNNKELDIQSNELVETLNEQEFFGVMTNNDLIMGKGSKLFLFSYKNKEQSEWEEIIDLSSLNITNIEHITVNTKNQLLIVTNN